MQNEIENEPRFKKDVYDSGFGHSLNDQYDTQKAAGKREMLLHHEEMMEGGQATYDADVKLGKSRVFYNGYKATLYAGLYIDRTADGVEKGLYPDTRVSGVDLRDLVDRIQNPPDESMVTVANKQAYDDLLNKHVESIANDMEKIRQAEPKTFLAIMARYQPPGVQADGPTVDEISEFAVKNFRSRWFNADEKITIEEAARMLMDVDSPRAVRKPLPVGKTVDELLTEWEQGTPKVPRSEVQKEWNAEEKATLKAFMQSSKLPEEDAKKELHRSVMRRFKPFMEKKIEAGQGPELDFYKIVPTWLVIDFDGKRTANGNLPLIRIPDPENYLVRKFTDYMFPQLQKEGKLREVVKSLSQGKAETLATENAKHPNVSVTANPVHETIGIKDAVFKQFRPHDMFRTQEAKERIAAEQKQKDENRQDGDGYRTSSSKSQDGTQKKNNPDDVVGKARKAQPVTSPAKLKPKPTTRKFAAATNLKKGRRPG